MDCKSSWLLSRLLYSIKSIAIPFRATYWCAIALSMLASNELASNDLLYSQETEAPEYSVEEQKQLQLAERFLGILEKNPRRGTALDRVYGHQIEFGTLDSLMASLAEQVEQSPSDGAKWMLIGLFNSQRGEDAAAAEAFKKAESLRPKDALAPYYYAQSLLRIGDSEEAISAMERAITRNPPRADLLEIYQQLGRVHQRAQRTEEALQVWQRLEKLFPDDPRVLEQIAVILSEEGQPAQALPRYEQLATLVTDDYRRTMFRISAAELKIKVKNREEGIADLEKMLSDLNPDSWLYRDVRRRIENVFLRSSDQDSLVSYYEKWLGTHPDDVEAMSRVAKFLSASARVPEATEWMSKALKRAPTRNDLRKSFIDQLVEQQNYAEATSQYRQICEADANNQDYLRDWGKMVLRDKAVPIAERNSEATKIWNRMLENSTSDPLVCSQVADLFRNANMNERALELYEKAVVLAPAQSQYREYLGEFYHIQKETDKALATWAAIATPPSRTAENVARVSEIYNSFGYFDQAIAEVAAACEMAPKDFSLQLKAAEYFSKATKYEDSLRFVAAAQQLASNDDERNAVISQKIDILQSSQKLGESIETLQESIAKAAAPSVSDWNLLARYLEADRKWIEANDAIDNALKIEPQSIPTLIIAARIAEASGGLARASELNRQLASIDRRSRDDYLMSVSRLEMLLGRSDAALEAAKELIVASPGNTDNYEFLAKLNFQLGKAEEGLDALRKAVRINPNEPQLIMALGSALADQLQTREAIEVYWRAFDKSEEVDDKTSLTMKLTPLYEQINQFDQLIERLERDRREEEKRRAATICLAQAYQTAGDLVTAKLELESLLSENTRDTNLLQQLAKLSQANADMDAAIGYQRQLVAIAPGHETETPLANMLNQAGYSEEASEILVRLTRREEDPIRLLRSLDMLLTQDNSDAVIGIVTPLLSQQRDDWELLYREAVAWTKLEKFAEAKTRFERLLAINKPFDALSTAGEERLKQSTKKAKSDSLRGIQSVIPTRPSPLSMLGMTQQVQQATGLTNQDYYYQTGQGPQAFWAPDSYGVARLAAFGWLIKIEQNESSKEAKVDSAEPHSTERRLLATLILEKATATEASKESIYDGMFVSGLTSEYSTKFQLAKRLAKEGGLEEKRFFMLSLMTRGIEGNQQVNSSNQQSASAKKPLIDADLDFMMQCYTEIENAKSDAANAQSNAFSNQNVIVSNGQVYVLSGGNYIAISGSFAGANQIFGIVLQELQLAGRDQAALELREEIVAKAKTADQIIESLSILFNEKQFDRIPDLLNRWHEQAIIEIAEAPISPAKSTGNVNASSPIARQWVAMASDPLMRWVDKLGTDEEYTQIIGAIAPMLDVAVKDKCYQLAVQEAANLANRKRQTSLSAANANQSKQIYATLYTGSKQQGSQFTTLVSSPYSGQSLPQILRQTFEVFRRQGLVEDFVAQLRERVEKATSDNERVIYQLYTAEVLWWNDEKEEAIERIQPLLKHYPKDDGLKYDIAALYQQLNDVDRAMEIIDSIVALDQKAIQRRELSVLPLAERLGDTQRARKAIERLFGMRLDSQTQVSLVDSMRRLGMQDMVDAILKRAERSVGNSNPAIASLMMLYRGQGKTEQAKQLARVLMRRTVSPISALATTTVNPRNYGLSESNERDQALKLLLQTGDLKTMIEQSEAQMASSPSVMKAYENLVEYYDANNQRDKATAMLEKIVELKPMATGYRLKLAEYFEQTGNADKACDTYLVILKQKPSLISNEFYLVQNAFQRTNRTTELVKTIQEIDIKSIGQPYIISNLVSNLTQSKDQTEAAIALIEKAYDAFPSYRSSLIRNIYDQELWKNERFYSFAKTILIPSALEIKSSPWAGIDSIASYSGNGEVTAVFHNAIKGLAGSLKLDELQASIASTVEASPEWLGGQVMLGLIDLQSNHKEAGILKFEKLFKDLKVIATMPSDTCWIVGQELFKSESTIPLAVALFEHAIRTPSQNRMSQLEYSPVSKLVDTYETLGRKKEARDLIMKSIQGPDLQNYDPNYQAYQQIENTFWATGKLNNLGSIGDSIKLYQKLIADPDMLNRATQYYSGNSITLRLATGLQSAMARLKTIDPNEAVDQILSVDALASDASLSSKTQTPSSTDFKNATDVAVIDLMLTVPDIEQLTDLLKRVIQSSNKDSISANKGLHLSSKLLDTVLAIAKDAKGEEAILNRLDVLEAAYPEDLSIQIASTLIRSSHSTESMEPAAVKLVEWIQKRPFERLSEGRRPNSRQIREAAIGIPLWLVARELIGTSAWETVGKPLADYAFESAKRQANTDGAMSILQEWGERTLKASDREATEKIWSEWLQLAIKRPHGLTASATPQASTAAIIPPLTINQFRQSMLIASLASKANFPKLSQKAVSESLRGGIPVSNLIANATQDRFGATMFVVGGSGGPPTETLGGEIESEVARYLELVVTQWADEGYSNEETYPFLKSLVFPDSRPQDIIIFPDSSRLNNALVSSLAAVLVRSSAGSPKLQEIRDEAKLRGSNPSSKVASLVLLALVAQASDDSIELQTAMKELADTVERQPSPMTIELACHAALPAIQMEQSSTETGSGKKTTNEIPRRTKKDETKPAELTVIESDAVRILQVALTQTAAPTNSQPFNNFQPTKPSTSKLARLVSRYFSTAKANEKIVEYYESLVVAKQKEFANYSGDYGQYMTTLQIAEIAGEAASNGLISISLDMMGRATDFDTSRYGKIDLSLPLAKIVQHSRSIKPLERYSLWADWTLPTETRRTIRNVAEIITNSDIPNSLAPNYRRLASLADSGLVWNLTELVDAAKQAGKLDELRQRFNEASSDKIPKAEVLQGLLLLASEDLKQQEQFVAMMNERLKSDQPSNTPANLLQGSMDSNMLVAALDAGVRSDLMRDALENIGSTNSDASLIALHRTAVNMDAQKLDPSTPVVWKPNLAYWTPSSSESFLSWISTGDQVVNQSGNSAYLNYPLSGEFDFEVDCHNGVQSSSILGYAGVAVQSYENYPLTPIITSSGNETLNRQASLKVGGAKMGHVRIESKAGQVRHYLNGYLVYEEKLSGTFPWVCLSTTDSHRSLFSNPRLSGSPEIPRRVELFSQNRMDGWSCTAFAETQPRLRTLAEPSDPQQQNFNNGQQPEPSEYDWKAEDGELICTKNSAAGDDPSWLVYQRPLQEGDKLSFELQHPDTRSAIVKTFGPTLGKIAFRLTSGGVRTHWIASSKMEQALLGTNFEYPVDDSNAKRAKSLGLKSSEWNRIDVSIEGNLLKIVVNDKEVYQRTVDDIADRRFGFFRLKREEVRIRNVSLTGNWPATVAEAFPNPLFHTTRPLSIVDRKLMDQLAPSEVHAMEASEVVRRARSMDEQESFKYLADWVLPNDLQESAHQRIRLHFNYATVYEQTSSIDDQLERILCPAIELVRIAGRVGELGSLRERLNAIEANRSVDVRARTAMQTMLEIEADAAKPARQLIATMHKELGEGLPIRMSRIDRVPELLVAIQAGRSRMFWQQGLDLVSRLLKLNRDSKSMSQAADGNQWQTDVSSAMGAIEASKWSDSNRFESQQLTQWSAVPYWKPMNRVNGSRPSKWLYQRGLLQHYPSETWSQMWFQSPLRGKYDITARLSTTGYKELALGVGMHAAMPFHNLQSTSVFTLMHGQRDVAKQTKLPYWDQSADFRVSVDNNRITTFVNGVQIHKEEFASTIDPWIVIQSVLPNTFASIQNIQIVGEPTIPDEIDLIDIAGWNSWRADMYGDSFSQTSEGTNPYFRNGDEMVGRLRKDLSASMVESLMMYSRPMLEDGEIEFETFYVPGDFEIHPAIGRSAFLIDPAGASLHRLTDAQWEVGKLASPVTLDNRTPMEGAQASSWKENDWNRVKLKLVGDQVTLFVNDQQVLQESIQEPRNERFFGLFRYSDKTQSRVRNVKYRGDWPKVLPSVTNQQMAFSSEGPFDIAAEGTAEKITIPLNQSFEQLGKLRMNPIGPKEGLRAATTGTVVVLKEGDVYEKWPGFGFDIPILADADITLDYRDLKMVRPESGWGVGLSLELEMDDAEGSTIEISTALDGEGKPVSKATTRRNFPDRMYSTLDLDFETVSGNFPSGQLRLVRRGGQVHCLYRETKQDEAAGDRKTESNGPFQWIQSVTVGGAGIQRISVQAKGSDAKAELSATLEKLEIVVGK